MASRTSLFNIPFNPDVLKWARMLGDYSFEDAAEAIKATAIQIEEWENRDSAPTVIQARKLANFYNRPFLEFFAKEIPDVQSTKLVPDFRLLRTTHTPSDNKILREVQSWAETQRLNAIDLYEINGEKIPIMPKPLYANVMDNPEIAANRSREIIDFKIQEQTSLKSTERGRLFNIIRQKLENAGILVFKNSQLTKCKARGLCVFNEPLPIIVVGSESPTGSAFTAMHEFGHILLKQSAISGINVPRTSTATYFQIENWCNDFASAFLMPKDEVNNIVRFEAKVEEISDEDLRVYSNIFSVSRHAMLVRLVQLQLVNKNYYWEIKRPQFLEEESQYKPGGRATYYGARYRNSNGELYTGLVLDAWASNKITNHNAGEFMGIKNLKHLFDIRNRFNSK